MTTEVINLLKQISNARDNELWWNNNILSLTISEQVEVLLSENPLETLKTILDGE